MQKLTVFLTLLLTLVFAIACGPQADPPTSDTDEAVSPPSGTEIDQQLSSVNDQPVEADVESADDPIILPPAETSIEVPTEVPMGPAEPSDELIALLPSYNEADIQETDSGLMYIIYEEGSGEPPVAGDTVVAHYTGYTFDGNKFDSSRDRDTTFEFPLGQGRVIRGWDEGFALMTPGTRALLIIPPDLGYGASGAGADIPPNATLFFDVELVEVRPVRKPIQVDEAMFETLESGVRVHDFAVGDGEEAVDGKVVNLDFAVWNAATGELFASSDDAPTPLGFKLGAEQMFAALQDGVRGMQVGGSRQIYMPADTLEGAGFPPATDIIFEVELVEVSEGSPALPTELSEDAYQTLESGILYADIEVGEGEALVEGTLVNMHYTAWLDDGTPFDSSIDRNTPLQFPYGQAPIPGFNEALIDIVVGGSRQIVVPADIIGDLGLGEPRDVIFDIEILEP